MNTRLTTQAGIAALAMMALLAPGNRAQAAAVIYDENFDGITFGATGSQFQSGNALDAGQTLDEWSGTGAGVIHVVDHDGAGNLAPMLWAGSPNILTLNAAIQGSNINGRTYEVDFRASPSVYADGAQASTSAEGVTVEVLNAGGVVSTFTTTVTNWGGNMVFADKSFQYVGDGTGDIWLKLSPSNNVSRFNAAVDDLSITDLSLPSVSLLASARGDYQTTGAAGTTAGFNGGTGIADTEGSGRWNYLDGSGGSLLTFGSAGNAGNDMYGGLEASSLPALGDEQIFSNVSGPAPDEIQWHAGDNADAVMRWTAGADITDLMIIGEIDHVSGGTVQFDILVNGVNQFSVDLGDLAIFNLNGLSIDEGEHVEFILSDNGDGIGGDLADLKASIYGNVVPEPSSLALLGLGGLLIARRRRD